MTDPHSADLATALTARELAVLQVMAETLLDPAETAARLGITRWTVEKHLQHARDKLDVRRTRDAIRRLGLVA